jgi:site-specific DNA-methyltransferase (adenine-specific)
MSISRKALTRDRIKKKEARESRPDSMPPPSLCWDIHHSACADLIKIVTPGSVDWIITDPPYPKEFLSCYSDLAAFAAEALKPGGGCLVMTGQSYLPEVMRRLEERLKYCWEFAYTMPGGQAPQIWPLRINTFWKPLLWFSNGAPSVGDHWVGDILKSGGQDKRFHFWGQSENGMIDIIQRFTSAGQMICDPFLGGGATGTIAVGFGRYFIGADIDKAACEKSIARLQAIHGKGG